MAERVFLPVKIVNGAKWADLCVYGHSHEICGESVKPKAESFSFAGGHRVRLYSFKKNVHWKIPEGTQLDISGVAGAAPPRRQQGR